MAEVPRTEVLFAALVSRGSRYYLLVSGLLAIVGWGIYAYYVQFTTGLGVTGMRGVVSWGFYVVNFVFFIGISHVGALMSAILRLTNAEWRRPITRMAEVVTFASLIVAAIMPFIDLGRPDRIANVFFFARFQSPLTWDFLAIGTYFVGSVIFLYLPLIPDIAACRDRLKGTSRIRRAIYNTLSLGWGGTRYEMEHLEKGIRIMTILIIPIAISVHTVVSWDFAMNLRTGWNSTIFGPYFVGGALFSGVATVIMVVAVLTKFDRLGAYVTKKHFDNLGKLLLTLNIIVIYLTINEFLVPGYKFLQTSGQEGLWMSALIWGQYSPLFWFQIVGGLIVPALLVAVPRTRTVGGYFVAALLVNAGMWVERFNIVVPSLAVPQLGYPWGMYFPTWVEVSITAAAFSGFALIYAIFTRTFPIISIWENEEGEHATSSPVAHIQPSVAAAAPEERSTDRTTSPSRRGFLRTAMATTGGLTFGVASFAGLFPLYRPKQRSVSGSPTGRKVPISNLGRSLPLDEAKKLAKFSFDAPSRLPDGSVLSGVRVTEGAERVGLLYRNSALTPLSMYDEEIAVSIFISADPVIDSPPAYLPEGFVRVEIGGRKGFGRGPLGSNKDGGAEPGQIQWWKKGLRHSVFANAPVDELRRIAEALEAT